MNKKGFEFSFAWMFAIIVGAAVIFLAVYGTTKLITTEKTVSNSEIAQKLGVLFTPLETGSEDIKDPGAPITLDDSARVFNGCSSSGLFGEQSISLSVKSGIGNQWEKSGIPARFENKYIFSGDVVESKEFYVLSKPVNLPFKVADLIYLWAGKYCFVNAPDSIQSEIEGLENVMKIINFTSDLSRCSSGAKKVCFIFGGTGEGNGCDIVVYDSYVKKNGKTMYFGSITEDASLMYGAIFSDSDVYECQLKRIAKRASEMGLLMEDKATILSQKAGCSFENLAAPISDFVNITSSFKSSYDIMRVSSEAQLIRGLNNEISGCKLF